MVIFKNDKKQYFKIMKDIEKIMVYFPRDIAKKLKEVADKNTRSISGQVVHYVKQGLKIED